MDYMKMDPNKLRSSLSRLRKRIRGLSAEADEGTKNILEDTAFEMEQALRRKTEGAAGKAMADELDRRKKRKR